MHRSSESVAAIATALAKAQTELSNPEKAMVGTVYTARSDTPQSFRYASLSSGLDIVRKTLGGHQIAIAQTTDIDRASGMVNLTTVLLHTSGEWISSDWPVCRLSETAAPRRMGAALTYARRYALFTMVGIAGEDDIDAPDLINDDVKECGGRPAPNLRSLQRAPADQSMPAGEPSTRPKAAVEESAALRAQLIREIETLPEADLQHRAIAILKTKNRLSLQDAKKVEDAFAARMVSLPEVAAPPDPTAFQHIKELVEPAGSMRSRGCRPRRAKSSADESVAAQVLSKPVIDNDSRATEESETQGSPTKIDKSVLAISEQRRYRDKAHLKFVASHPCLICGRNPTDAHHLRFAQSRGMGLKVSDEFTVPLCRAHHRENHRFGDEQAWWAKLAIDPLQTSQRLWASTRSVKSR
jgi:ERF superfamily protein/putative HNHc nuclease